jgi:circadian clock protein KaiC
MSFEETAEELTQNCASLGYDLKGLTASRRLFLDYVHVERSEIQETGEYDLEGLFITAVQNRSEFRTEPLSFQ